MVGACLGFNPTSHGHPETGKVRYVPSAGPDGLMVTGSWMGYHYPYPPPEPRLPQNLGLQDLFVIGMTSPFLDSTDREEMWKKFELPYRPEVMINFGANLVMSIANKDAVAASLAKYKFIVSFDLFLNETSNFVDIVLPDCGYLQSFDSRANFPVHLQPAGRIGRMVLADSPARAAARRRAAALCRRAARDRRSRRIPRRSSTRPTMPGSTCSRRIGWSAITRYSYEQICDAELKNNFGAERGLDWFKQNGLIKWKKKPEEVYWRPFVDVRVPIYWEFLKPIGDKIAAIAEPRGLQYPDGILRAAAGLPAVPLALLRQAGLRLLRLLLPRCHPHQQLHDGESVARRGGAARSVLLHDRDQCERRQEAGLSDGQLVWVESETGRKVKGRLKLTEGIHPEGLGFAAMCGHWSSGMPIAKGKGVFYNDLLELDWEHASPTNLNLDLCVKVRVMPAESVS